MAPEVTPNVHVLRFFAKLSAEHPWHEASRADFDALRSFARGAPELFAQAAFISAEQPPDEPDGCA